MRPLSAFTLVELLVVITIIVVLLALLAPAMDKAIYEAELAVCGAHLRGIATGANLYAVANQRSYPSRGAVSTNRYPVHIKQGNTQGAQPGAAWDDRPKLRPYLAMDNLLDPLCIKVDFDHSQHPSPEWIYASYNLWFGWKYTGQTGMRKVGNRFSWTDRSKGAPYTHNFDWLASDLDLFGDERALQVEVIGTHPDANGLMTPTYADNGKYEFENVAVDAGINAVAGITYSWWRHIGNNKRGDVDLQFAAADGAVARYDSVGPDVKDDERFAHAPWITNNSLPGVWQHVARR